MDYTPGRGQDKHSRVNACAPLFESGQVYYPRDEHWAQEVIEECAAFLMENMMIMWTVPPKLC